MIHIRYCGKCRFFQIKDKSSNHGRKVRPYSSSAKTINGQKGLSEQRNRRDEKALDELGYQKQQDPSDGIAVPPFSARCPDAIASRHASKEFKDRLKGAAFNEGFISAFRTSILGWIVSETGRSICIQMKIIEEKVLTWKHVGNRHRDWLNLRDETDQNLTEFRQFCHV